MQTIKRIHVNQHNIKANAKNGNTDLSIFTVKNRGKTHIGQEVWINGHSILKYSPDHPLSCGAKVWIETHADVVIDGDTDTEVRLEG
jgi:hypothetical protein